MPRKYTRLLRIVILNIALILTLAACGPNTASTSSNEQVVLNLGYFPNLTHAAALVGVARGTFQQTLGQHVKLQTKTFNAGPAEIQALLANSIDIAYVGPSPAISGYVQSHGTALRIIAGAASAGALFVVQANEQINSPADLATKKLATPQKGGTQDVALRYYLQQHGLKTSDKGGNIQVISSDNASILSLFKAGKIDGAWMPEPWATRLIVEGKGKVFLDERSLWPAGQFTTTTIVVRTAFYNAHPDLVAKFLQAHVETVQYIQTNPTEAQALMNAQIKSITGSAIKSDELALAFKNLTVTYDPIASTLIEQADRAYALGFVSSKPDLSGIYNLGPLNQVLEARGLAKVSGP